MILAVVLVIFFVSLMIGVPVVFSIILASGMPILFDARVGLNQMSSIILQQMRSFPLVAIPLYILCGRLLKEGGVTEDLVYISRVLIGRIRGALAHVNVVTSIFFAGISGSSVADVATIGPVLIPAMKKQGYDAEFSATLTAASSTIGSIIPPSILMIIYGAIAQTSIAALFLAGIVPGVLVGVVQMGYSWVYAKRHRIKENEAVGEFAEITRPMVVRAVLRSIFPVSIFFLIIVGITAGVFTPTEAAAVAVVYVLGVQVLIYRKRNWRGYLVEVKQAVIDASVIYLLIAVASFMAWVLTYYQVMIPILEAIKASNVGPEGFLVLLTLLYVLLGTFMEPASAMLIVVPLLVPIVELLNIDPTVVGIVTVMAIRVGTVTPPYGLSALMAARIAETTVLRMMKYIVIFVVFYVIVVFLLIYFQDAILFLPRVFLG
jgi:C4-dicarboxylate transporter, DctM subunit